MSVVQDPKAFLSSNWASDRRRRRPRGTGVAFAPGGGKRPVGEQTSRLEEASRKVQIDQVSPLAASGRPRLGGETSKTSSPAGTLLNGSRSPQARIRLRTPCRDRRIHGHGRGDGGGEGWGKSARAETGWAEDGGGGSPVSKPDATEGSGSVSADKQTQVAV